MRSPELKPLWPGQRDDALPLADLRQPLTWWQTMSAIAVGAFLALLAFWLLLGVAFNSAAERAFKDFEFPELPTLPNRR